MPPPKRPKRMDRFQVDGGFFGSGPEAVLPSSQPPEVRRLQAEALGYNQRLSSTADGSSNSRREAFETAREKTTFNINRSAAADSVQCDLPLDLSTYNPGPTTSSHAVPNHVHPFDDQAFLPRPVMNHGDAFPGKLAGVGMTQNDLLPLFVHHENASFAADGSSFVLPFRNDCLPSAGHVLLGHHTAASRWITEEQVKDVCFPEVNVARKQTNAIDRLRAHLERRQEVRPTEIFGETAGSEQYPDGACNDQLSVFQDVDRLLEVPENRLLRATNPQQCYNPELEVRVQNKQRVNGAPEERLNSRRNVGDYPARPGRPSLHSVQEQLLLNQPDQRKSPEYESNGDGLSKQMQFVRYSVLNPLSTSGGSVFHERQRNPDSHPDSTDSRSLPEFVMGSGAESSPETLRRTVSADAGLLVETENRRTLHGADPESKREEGGQTPEAYSPDQSADSVTYKTGNLPSIIASARLNDDYDFTSSFMETQEDAAQDRQTGKTSRKTGFRNRRNGVLARLQNTISRNGKASGKGNSPEPPSSTFDSDLENKTKDDGFNISVKTSESTIPCKICQDVANGFHYGVWSCEGCKAFFKRSITGSARYVCPADNNCTINRLRKKSCQACRLRKCYEFGMSPGNCRGENGSKFGRKRKFSEINRDKVETHDTTKQTDIGDCRAASPRVGQANQQSVTIQGDGRQSVVTDTLHRTSSAASESDYAYGVSGIVEHLMAVERPVRYADHDEETPGAVGSRLKMFATVMKLVNTQLMDIVTWSLNLPGFRELNLNVRTQLLVNSWSEVLILTNVFHSLQSTNVCVMAPNLHLSRELCEDMGILALYNRLMPIVRCFQDLELTHREMLLMQAIILVNNDFIMPRVCPQLDELRTNLMHAWNQPWRPYGRLDRPPAAGAAGSQDRRFRLLLALPHIKHCSLILLRILNEISRDNRIPVCSLLQEMIDTRFELDHVSILERFDEVCR